MIAYCKALLLVYHIRDFLEPGYYERLVWNSRCWVKPYTTKPCFSGPSKRLVFSDVDSKLQYISNFIQREMGTYFHGHAHRSTPVQWPCVLCIKYSTHPNGSEEYHWYDFTPAARVYSDHAKAMERQYGLRWRDYSDINDRTTGIMHRIWGFDDEDGAIDNPREIESVSI